MLAARVLPLLLLAPFAAAQQVKWQLPVGGLARFLADEEFEPAPDGALPGCPLPHATILLHSELAAVGTHVENEPQDWRWIAPHLAFDLRLHKPGKVTLRLPRVAGLGDLELTGTAHEPADGKQRFELQWKVAAPQLSADEKRAQALGGKPWFGGTGSGTLQLERTFDSPRGVVAEFRATLKIAAAFGPYQGSGRLDGTFTQHWQLKDVLGYRDTGFEARVTEAIRTGCDAIVHELRPDRPEFATEPAARDHPCGEGRLALALQTLLAAGRAADEPAIAAGFHELARREIVETYSLSTAILAVEAKYASPRERDDLLAGVLKAPAPRQVRPNDAALLAAWTKRLLQNRDGSVDGAYRSRWWYLGGKGFDNSNSQYALLALWSARLCQQPVDASTWLAAAQHWLDVQQPKGEPARPLRLVDLRELREQGSKALAATGSARTIAPRGFCYQLPASEPAYGSMTCAGLAGLALCAAALDDGSGKKSALDGRIDDGLRAGFAWLAANRTVRWNAGPPPHRNEFFFYWLYGLERACELSRVGLIDAWDWYHDGAQVLLALQDADGKFGRSLEEQCFAVLFLKKAQIPVLTGPR